MNAKQVELAVENYFNARQNLIIPNVSWGFLPYEADLVVIRKSGYLLEVEIKVSKADLIKDKDKNHSHNFNKFKQLYFAIPEKLLPHKEHIPERAGILVCSIHSYENKKYYKAKLVRTPKTNEADPIGLKDQYELARLGALRIWALKRRLLELKPGKE